MSEKDFNKENRPDDMYPSVENCSNTELLEEIDRIMEQGENMDVERVEYLLAALQKRAPVMEDYDPVKQWEKVQEDHPLFFTEDALDTVPTKKKVLRGNQCSRRQSGPGGDPLGRRRYSDVWQSVWYHGTALCC